MLLDVLYFVVALAWLPVLAYQALFKGKRRGGWAQRFGAAPRRAGDRPCIWIHAVSLGEVNATHHLVAKLDERLPEYDLVISATTDTGYVAALRHYPGRLVFRFPLDFSFAVRRAIRRIRPNAVVLMELEVWPNFLRQLQRRGIPVGIANGRVTEHKSMRRFGLPIVRRIARRMFRRIAFVAAQNSTYAARFEQLGVPGDRITTTGTMKYDTAVVADCVEGDAALAAALGIGRDRPLLVAGSTGPGEEDELLAAYKTLLAAMPGLQLAIVPRKPERFDEVARLIEARGHACIRRSRRTQGPLGAPASDVVAADRNSPPVYLGDTMGELRKFYSLAAAVFVGRSLVPIGGSDPIEVAGLGRAMLFGPHMENFADVTEQLLAANAAVQVGGAAGLSEPILELLGHPQSARDMGRRAQEVVRSNTGATERTVDLICGSLS